MCFGEKTGVEVDKTVACDWTEEHGVAVLSAIMAWFVGTPPLRRDRLGITWRVCSRGSGSRAPSTTPYLYTPPDDPS